MASDLDVGRLRLLREVGLRGSIAGAARAVGLTASAVSQQLTVLEREAGTALLHRSSRGVELTGAGRLLADRAAEVLDLLAATAAELDRLSGSLAGRVRIAAVASAAATFVSDGVRALRESAPEVEVSVVAAEPDRGIALLLTGDVDVAVVDEYDAVPLALPEGAVVRELAVEPLVLVRPAPAQRGDAGHRAGRPVALTELAGADWVMPPADAACGRAVRAACRIAGFEPRVRWETDDMLLLSAAVAAGHGVAVLPRRSFAGAATGAARGGPAIAAVALRAPTPSRRLLAVARGSVAARPVVTAVLRAVEAAVAAG
ncbi:ModE molybdate transport repressor domain-containing protein [Jatrophihabitans endophyticus]|uniref:ModE molybdate transport repressor domain-containing protein n=1 Tax=Jatrophihabitans endophyticus TaxID=1206085 RepID=A0A1M5TDK5_9ACTN|nr:LysR family transcriptional regulator [Jatrophihabitans endophyticus]SHH48766.1 ModE molybdate transport repressor domain-containing protein [Jatrophihabitans endophyticus]